MNPFFPRFKSSLRKTQSRTLSQATTCSTRSSSAWPRKCQMSRHFTALYTPPTRQNSFVASASAVCIEHIFSVTIHHVASLHYDVSLFSHRLEASGLWGCKVPTHLALPGPSAAAACTACRSPVTMFVIASVFKMI